MINELKKEFPLVNFFKVDHVLIPRNEDASYPFGAPKPERIEGDFIRLENPMGGADTVRASDVEAIRRIAAWHQARAEANGFGA
jgi:hypothetical protein